MNNILIATTEKLSGQQTITNLLIERLLDGPLLQTCEIRPIQLLKATCFVTSCIELKVYAARTARCCATCKVKIEVINGALNLLVSLFHNVKITIWCLRHM